MNALAADIYAEGLVIPPLKVVSRGVIRHDVKNLIMANIRIPVNSTGDLIAHIEAARVGEARLQQPDSKVRVGDRRGVHGGYPGPFRTGVGRRDPPVPRGDMGDR